jgi:hypothetical protein
MPRTPHHYIGDAQMTLFHAGVGMSTLGLFCFLAGGAVFGFFVYHLTLVFRNVTTSETFRWSEAHERYRLKLQLDQEGADASKFKLVRRKGDGSVDREISPLHCKPVNTYKLSLWQNLIEVMYPPAFRHAEQLTTAADVTNKQVRSTPPDESSKSKRH